MQPQRIDLYSETFELPASADAVFALLSDVARWPTWCNTISRGAHSSQTTGGQGGGQSRAGDTLSFSPRFPLFLGFPFTPKVREVLPGRRLDWGVQTPYVDLIHGFTFEPLGPESCRVHHYEHVTGPLGRVLRLLNGSINVLDRGMSAGLRAHYAKATGAPAPR